MHVTGMLISDLVDSSILVKKIEEVDYPRQMTFSEYLELSEKNTQIFSFYYEQLHKYLFPFEIIVKALWKTEERGYIFDYFNVGGRFNSYEKFGFLLTTSNKGERFIAAPLSQIDKESFEEHVQNTLTFIFVKRDKRSSEDEIEIEVHLVDDWYPMYAKYMLSSPPYKENVVSVERFENRDTTEEVHKKLKQLQEDGSTDKQVILLDLHL